MTVSELMAMLSELPGDMEVHVNHERFKIHPAALFVTSEYHEAGQKLLIVPSMTITMQDAEDCWYWRRIRPIGE